MHKLQSEIPSDDSSFSADLCVFMGSFSSLVMVVFEIFNFQITFKNTGAEEGNRELANSQQTFAIFRGKALKRKNIQSRYCRSQICFRSFHPEISYFSVSGKDFGSETWHNKGLTLGILSKYRFMLQSLTPNSHPSLQTGSQILKSPSTSSTFYRLLLSCSWEQNIRIHSFPAGTGVFHLQKRAQQEGPAQTPLENHSYLGTAKGRVPTSACLTYCCS